MRALASLAARRGIRLWVVGGVLRDALDRREAPEIDVVVSRDCAALAAAMEAAGAGKAVSLSDANPVVFRIATPGDIDCAEMEGGSIEADMARRDFTVNAVAFDPVTREWIDPFGGIADLADRRLRMVSEANLVDDPLRALRVPRFMATHALRPDRETLRVVRKVAPLLRRVAPERIRVELVKMLEASRVTEAIDVVMRTGLLESAFGVRASEPRRSRFLQRLDSASVASLPSDQRLRLRLALLAEALNLSPVAAARWLARLRFSRDEVRAVEALMILAGRLRALRAGRESWSWVRDAGENRTLALRLFVLLHPDQGPRARRLARLRPRGHRLEVSGRDVIAWLGIAPGPRVGELLRELEIEDIRGAIRSRSAARKWLIEKQNRRIPSREGT
jgi:tRNA nucleotidyltransferase (CCA-adding enzyme)